MADWVRRSFGKGQIDRAGKLLTPWWLDRTAHRLDVREIGRHFDIIQNWRTSHAFPLNSFQVNLRSRARRVEKGALVAQRLKRFSSLMNKLAREPQMKLSQMHDLGGCRAIVTDVQAVDELVRLYRGDDKVWYESEGTLKYYDYIRNPKADGYRGIHLVGRYTARQEEQEAWNGQRIEIQLRSRLQHAFATAVETVTTFTREPLKFGGGPAEWKRFFALTGSLFALRENTPFVPGTPTDEKALTSELREQTKSLKVVQRLRGWAAALKRLPRSNVKGFEWLLLVLDIRANTIDVTPFTNRTKAEAAVAKIEQGQQGDLLDAVLVGVKSARELRFAYPNYYADTGAFINALTDVLRP